MKYKIIPILVAASFILTSNSASAETPLPPTPDQTPILVVDKCPEFCPPSIKGPTKKKVCTMALIPVPNKKHWYWTDGCKSKMVYMPPTKKGKR